MAKRKKGVKDKYYFLAKEQGYRARSCFKLIQIDRKYGLLAKSKRVIDLCAAPGGWLQVCAKTMPKSSETQIIGVDLLPIKALRGVKTFEADITTPRCRQLIKHELKGKKADLVLCDGAPNVGADYTKDAYVQSELALCAVRFATDHLAPGGAFVSKVFRSSDYNALMWVFQKLFRKVSATKPASSRNVSAEIFVVCEGYISPDKIDPKLLDPKHVFKQVEDDKDAVAAKLINDLFNKKSKTKRNRSGYNDDAPQTMHVANSVAHFMTSKEPVRVLAQSSALTFDADSELYAQHALTTTEIRACLADLKVLGQSEFRGLLRWRTKMVAYIKAMAAETEAAAGTTVEAEEENGDEGQEDEGQDELDEDERERLRDLEIDDELRRLSKLAHTKAKRVRKHRARERARQQRRKDMGMASEGVDGKQEAPFSIEGLFSSKEDLDLVSEVNLSDPRSVGMVPTPDDYNKSADDSALGFEILGVREAGEGKSAELYLDEEEGRMEAMYAQFKDGQDEQAPMTVRERRQQLKADKRAKRKPVLFNELFLNAKRKRSELIRKLEANGEEVGGSRQDGDDSDDSDDEEDDEEEVTSAALAELAEERQRRKTNPLLARFGEENDGQGDDAAKRKQAERWFKQSLFDGAGDDDEDEMSGDEEDDNSKEEVQPRRERKRKVLDEQEEKIPSLGLPSQGTDKAARSKKRARDAAKRESKAAKKAAQEEAETREHVGDLRVVPAPKKIRSRDDKDEKSDSSASKAPTAEEVKANEVRELIRMGMGRSLQDSGKNEKSGFEIARRERRRSVDSEGDSDDGDELGVNATYDSDEYDSDERATHLALGAQLIKRSQREALLDSCYNRYAWNDPADLPEWFVDDENQHYRPQLPVTKEMVEAVKARFKDLAAKPIHKVAEARARKKRKLLNKVNAAKQKAAAIVDAPDLGPRSKMKAIEKLYKGATLKRPGAVFVVSKKAAKGKVSRGSSKGGQRVKVVDKRLKADASRKRFAKSRGKKSGKNKRRPSSK